jgi:uncharacterized Zn-binding protein involved in type VI secretion
MSQPAARIGDPVLHPIPPVLTGAPVSTNVLISNRPAWRGIDPADLANLMKMIEEAKAEVTKAQTASASAAGTPAAGAAQANEAKVKLEQAAKIADAIGNLAGKGVSIHACGSLLPTPAPGIVITGSQTVQINGLPACRMGDTILEGLLHAPNQIAAGDPTVMIGG